MFSRLFYQITHLPPRLAVRYDRCPPSPTYTIVFLHGIAASFNAWKPSISRLAKDAELSQCRLIMLDLLGFGRSSHAHWLKYNYQDYDTALNRTLKKLHVHTPLILVGHSMGGLIAVNYALHHAEQVAYLVLASPPVIMPAEIARTPDKFYLQTYGSLQKLASHPAGKVVASFANHATSLESKYLHTVGFERAMHNVILNSQNYHDILRLAIPTTIIHGRFDPLVYKPNLVKIAKHNPHVKLISTMSHHDIDSAKLAKVITTLHTAVRKREGGEYDAV